MLYRVSGAAPKNTSFLALPAVDIDDRFMALLPMLATTTDTEEPSAPRRRWPPSQRICQPLSSDK
jgi:hypothetical protein